MADMLSAYLSEIEELVAVAEGMFSLPEDAVSEQRLMAAEECLHRLGDNLKRLPPSDRVQAGQRLEDALHTIDRLRDKARQRWAADRGHVYHVQR